MGPNGENSIHELYATFEGKLSKAQDSKDSMKMLPTTMKRDKSMAVPLVCS